MSALLSKSIMLIILSAICQFETASADDHQQIRELREVYENQVAQQSEFVETVNKDIEEIRKTLADAEDKAQSKKTLAEKIHKQYQSEETKLRLTMVSEKAREADLLLQRLESDRFRLIRNPDSSLNKNKIVALNDLIKEAKPLANNFAKLKKELVTEQLKASQDFAQASGKYLRTTIISFIQEAGDSSSSRGSIELGNGSDITYAP